ncbi:MAG: winged helix-turn-helix domain-containing protein [Candidatus Thermoplasmatota archaeon]
MDITLDYASFKALASGVRIDILKILENNQSTVSELSRKLEISKSALLRHLEKLINAGLVKKIDDERKWVYYRITPKGMKILHPESVKISIILSIFIVGFLFIFLSVYLVFYPFPYLENFNVIGIIVGFACLFSSSYLLIYRRVRR